MTNPERVIEIETNGKNFVILNTHEVSRYFP